MAARPIVAPYTVFTDSNGNPLDNGYVYIGTAGLNPETNPINVYLDSALTIPIAQPIRTLSGYPIASGSPVQLYVDFIDYSITIRDRSSVFVVSNQNAVTQFTAGNITNVPAGSISSTDVQSAINELDTDKAALPEYGSFTAALTATAGTITLGTATMRYRKEGVVGAGKVDFWGYIVVGSVAAPTGQLTLGGFPYPCRNNGDSLSCFAIRVSNLSGGVGGSMQSTTVVNTTTALINRMLSGIEYSDLATYVQAGGTPTTFTISGSYAI
jgi:hypothetical protein